MIGFIGLGHMGYEMLNNLFLRKAFKGDKVGVYNRTEEKCNYFVERYGARKFNSIDEILSNCNIIISSLHGEIQNKVLCKLNNQYFISVSNALEIQTMEKFYTGEITRLMPTISMDGYTLIANNSRVSSLNKSIVYELFSNISTPIECSEDDLEVLTLVTSSGPGLYSAILLEFQKSFSKRVSIKDDVISKMINNTLLGTLERMNKGETYSDIINKVATKGGLTEVGAEIIKNECSKTFENLISKSMDYNSKRKDLIKNKLEADL